jgi:hypothetical protein
VKVKFFVRDTTCNAEKYANITTAHLKNYDIIHIKVILKIIVIIKLLSSPYILPLHHSQSHPLIYPSSSPFPIPSC